MRTTMHHILLGIRTWNLAGSPFSSQWDLHRDKLETLNTKGNTKHRKLSKLHNKMVPWFDLKPLTPNKLIFI